MTKERRSDQDRSEGQGPPIADPLSDDQFTNTFRSEISFVCRSLRRLGVADRDVEDLAHETFLTLHRRRDDWDRSRPLRPWLFGISYRVASDYRRKSSHRHERFAEHIEIADTARAADQEIAAQQDRQLVLDALEAIELDRRAVFIMHELNEVPVKEVAEALDIPVFTVYSRLRVAREEFTAAVRRIQLRRGVR